jgi:hypothetical protein
MGWREASAPEMLGEPDDDAAGCPECGSFELTGGEGPDGGWVVRCVTCGHREAFPPIVPAESGDPLF